MSEAKRKIQILIQDDKKEAVEDLMRERLGNRKWQPFLMGLIDTWLEQDGAVGLRLPQRQDPVIRQLQAALEGPNGDAVRRAVRSILDLAGK